MTKYAVALALMLATAWPALATEPKPASSLPIFCDDQGKDREAILLARGIAHVAFPKDQQSASMERLLAGLTDQFRNARETQSDITPEIDALIDAKYKEIPAQLLPLINEHLPRLNEATACAYSRLYTLEELRDISAFAHTPSGSRFLSTLTDALVDPAVAAANEDYLRKLDALSQELQRELIEDILLQMSEKEEIKS